ncbi:Clp protease N-terminal domain-containing protein [Auraticoccus monumenti]|uniref:Clp amino terminal domain-containing protein, pathogenicity island component n=1 Tax=Auraticoccus monumenti TaxID=675864 RepID=A0A1G6TZX5_9ACTN|nr:Clp protease N-terminal domain-containing protein [Auraticoccus monumenti]SDD34628.1 Clp amino terminal domain-containing protein, pathogenicity island component [Auraticoccus monumenti]
MSLSDLFAASQRISLVASEEARRLGHPEVDVEHVLLALLLTDGRAGAVLRSCGVMLAAARTAVETEHVELVARLGVTSPRVPPQELREGAGLDWSERALGVMRGIKDWSDDLGLLNALLDEPSGFVGRVVARLGVEEDVLRAGLDDGVDPPPVDPLSEDLSWVSHTHIGFVPAAPQEVWTLVADPLRRPEWDILAISVEAVGEGRWRVETTSGRPERRRPAAEDPPTTMDLVELERHPGSHVEWDTSWQGRRGRTTRQRLRVVVLPTTGGTRVVLRLASRQRRGWRGVLPRRLVRVQRLFMRQVLISLAGGLSRALR